MEFYDTV